jgi:hypothetical protein
MSEPATAASRTGYAPVNGLRMYYEIHNPDREKGPARAVAARGVHDHR